MEGETNSLIFLKAYDFHKLNLEMTQVSLVESTLVGRRGY